MAQSNQRACTHADQCTPFQAKHQSCSHTTLSTVISHNSQSEVRSGSYAVRSWLQQQPREDPWSAVSRFGVYRSGDKDRTQADKEREAKVKESSVLENGKCESLF